MVSHCESFTKVKADYSTIEIELTQFEKDKLALPVINTLTYYTENLCLTYLRTRLIEILKANPWLTARLVLKDDKALKLEYNDEIDYNKVIDTHLTVVKRIGLEKLASNSLRGIEQSCFVRDDTYEEQRKILEKYVCVPGRKAINNDTPMWRVTVLPAAASRDSSTAHMYCLLFSMHHTLGDGYTYYTIYKMMSNNQTVLSMVPTRLYDLEASTESLMGKEAMEYSASKGVIVNVIRAKLVKKVIYPDAVAEELTYLVAPEWIESEKQEAYKEGLVSFISSNDALTSWFFKQVKCDVGFMMINLRNRLPGVTAIHAGNYEAPIPYFVGDFETPSLIRKSILTDEGKFNAKRAGGTNIPGVLTSCWQSCALMTNWATFYEDVILTSIDGESLTPLLHEPAVSGNMGALTTWSVGVLFRPRGKETAMRIKSFTFDRDIPIHSNDVTSPILGQKLSIN